MPFADRVESNADAARAAAARLRHWLLHGPAQLSDGRHCGGVAGRVEGGRPVYVYAEITGYFLHWLADLGAHEAREVLGERARRAIDWSTRQFSAGRVPPTRAYLDAAASDWRNGAVFFFDLAMLLRGSIAIAEAGIEAPPPALLDAVIAQLAQLADDGALRASRPLGPDVVLPRRWSTLGGPFLLKASTRVALTVRSHELPATLLRACAHELARWSPGAANIPLDQLHPTLYFAEGLLLAQPRDQQPVGELLTRCVALQRADGSLPEADGGSPVARSDIIAQALRLGVLLRQDDALSAPSDAQLDRLATALIARVDHEGTIAFDPAADSPEPNVWCAMFAEQALRWFADWRDGAPSARIEALV
jgi:hypothetical protein